MKLDALLIKKFLKLVLNVFTNLRLRYTHIKKEFAFSVCRLRSLLRKLQHGEISADLLQRNLHYAARVLEAVFIDETK